MADNIDKTRPEQLGERSFVGTGVDTIPDLMEEQKDPRQMMQEMINEALSNVVGATVIQDVPDQIEYNFIGGGVTRNEFNNALTEIYETMIDNYDSLMQEIWRTRFWFTQQRMDLQRQIDNLESGTGKGLGMSCKAYLGSNQLNVEGVAFVRVALDTAAIDPEGMFDASSNKITVPLSGTYLVIMSVNWNVTVADVDYHSYLYVNGGAGYLIHEIRPSNLGSSYTKDAALVNLDAGDYLQLYVLWNSEADTADLLASYTHLSATLIRRT